MVARLTSRDWVRTWLRFYPLAMVLLMAAPSKQAWPWDADEAATIRLVAAANTAELAPKLEAVFHDMQAGGELTAIRHSVIAELLRRAEQGLPNCDEDYACFEPSGESSHRAAGSAAP